MEAQGAGSTVALKVRERTCSMAVAHSVVRCKETALEELLDVE